MESEEAPGVVEMFFFPFVGGGHQIPMIDTARVFASHGAKSTIIATPTSAPLFQNSILRDQQIGRQISIHALRLPEEAVAPDAGMSATPFTDTSVLQEPLRLFLLDRRPDCIVVDLFHLWAAELIDGLGIRKIVFTGSGIFSRCVTENLRRYAPQEKVGSDHEPFLVPGLPDPIVLTRSQLPPFAREKSGPLGNLRKGEEMSFGFLINSFYDLEPAYVEYYRKEMGKKTWVIGPVSLYNRNVADKAERGQQASIDEQSCLKWLGDKEPDSVLYISFGSLARFSPLQLIEIAHGLEASNHPFIWVVGKIFMKSEGTREEEENWLPDGFEERIKESKKGLIIRGWAPQLLLLEHPAVGAFMTHCGWNSTLEGVSSGMPMITWPITAEQFFNEKLVTDVLGIGVQVGSVEWMSFNVEKKALVGREKVEVAVKRLMDGDGAEVGGMRRRARELSEKAKRAVEGGGSSDKDANALIEELKSCRKDT
ncbi:abscisate beta-glucosyltransferase-like [Corylus avellana]|uniref:abscisate beta-glucosyltransferase-like n=1 Tax=Corylus avellana TaxID=13451 RepID=UPI00286D5045|nr:abscisate beta-glucosyltransferase-like [Corylus avellana]